MWYTTRGTLYAMVFYCECSHTIECRCGTTINDKYSSTRSGELVVEIVVVCRCSWTLAYRICSAVSHNTRDVVDAYGIRHAIFGGVGVPLLPSLESGCSDKLFVCRFSSLT